MGETKEIELFTKKLDLLLEHYHKTGLLTDTVIERLLGQTGDNLITSFSSRPQRRRDSVRVRLAGKGRSNGYGWRNGAAGRGGVAQDARSRGDSVGDRDVGFDTRRPRSSSCRGAA